MAPEVDNLLRPRVQKVLLTVVPQVPRRTPPPCPTAVRGTSGRSHSACSLLQCHTPPLMFPLSNHGSDCAQGSLRMQSYHVPRRRGAKILMFSGDFKAIGGAGGSSLSLPARGCGLRG